MALQTISQILSPTNAPYINGSAARLRFSAAVLRNLYQGLVEKDGKGVDDNFVSASEAEDSAQIIVHRILPTQINPREIGSSKNGAAYSQNQHYTQTISVGIEILQIVDDPILIPRVQQDLLPVDLLKEQVQIFSDRLATILNGATLASKFLTTYKAKSEGKTINETVLPLSGTGEQIRNAYVSANGLLDEGDEDNGLDIFPRKTRICVVKTSVAPILKTSGVLSLGGANEAYAILKNAGLTNDGERIEDDGYVGTIDGVEVRVISNESLKHASLFLGFPKYELKNSAFLGYIASSYANARGVSTSKQTKVVDEVNGQGVRLLPYVKFGVACWYPKGNSLLVSELSDVFGGLKAILTALSVTATVTYKVKGAASRLFPVFGTLGGTTNGSTTVTLHAQALDDFNVDHLVAGYYIVTTSTKGALTTVDAFVKAYKDGTITNKGSAQNILSTGSGNVTVTSLSTGQWVNVLAIADDGSCSIVSKQVTAS